MSTRDRWLAEGLAVLASEGAAGVRADRIAARLRLTKGSFFHHFSGIVDYRRALLERHEHDQSAKLRGLAAQLRDAAPEAALVAMPDRFADLFDADLERAVRAWAIGDPAARAVQARLDSARFAFLHDMWRRVLDDDLRAHAAALVPHLIAVGASVVYPRPGPGDLRAVFDLLAKLVSSVPDTARREDGYIKRDDAT